MAYNRPFASSEKRFFRLETDAYLDKAIIKVLDSDDNVNEFKGLKEAMVIRIRAVDMLELLMAGLSKIQVGKNPETNEPFPYQAEREKAMKSLEKKVFSGIDGIVSSDLEKQNKWANSRFLLLMGALESSKPVHLELSNGEPEKSE